MRIALGIPFPQGIGGLAIPAGDIAKGRLNRIASVVGVAALWRRSRSYSDTFAFGRRNPIWRAEIRARNRSKTLAK